MKLSNENIEEYLLLLADNELDSTEEYEVRAFVEQHTAYKPMLEAYLATRLDSTEAFVFPDKESLMQPEHRVLPFKKRKATILQLAAAIVVVIGLGTVFMLMFTGNEALENDNNKVAAVHEEKIKRNVAPTSKVVKDTLMLAKTRKEENKHKSPDIRQQQKPGLNNSPAIAANTKPVQIKEQAPAYLESATLSKVPGNTMVQPEAIAMIEQRPGSEASIERNNLPEWLPVTDENLQGVNDLVAHIQALKDRIQEKTQSLKNTAFVIRFGDKQISIGK